MGNENTRGIKDKLTSSLKKVGAFAGDAGTGAKKAAGKISDQAKFAKTSVDDKVRAALDEAYAAKRKTAIENIARLRKANPDCNPKELIGLLGEELKAADESTSEKSEAFTAAASLYTLSVVEIHALDKKSNSNRQKLVDVVVALDSKTSKVIATVGGIAVAVLAKRFGPVGKVVKGAAKFGGKVALVSPVLIMAGIKNPGKKGAAWAVVAATEKILGEPPQSWPTESAPKASAKRIAKPAKSKTTAK